MLKVGLFGGTFSPPHIGHAHALRAFLEAEQPDRTIVMPTFIPPHKVRQDDTSAADRLEMARLAFSFSDRITVSDLEILRGGKSYTSDTLKQLYREGERLCLLCGTDMFLTLPAWHCPEDIFRLADVVGIARENDPEKTEEMQRAAEKYRRTYGAVARLLTVPPVEISSGELRTMLQKDGLAEAGQYLSAPVADYIRQRGLYQI